MTTEDGKNAAAVALGRMGGKARAAGMSVKEAERDRQKGRPKSLGIALGVFEQPIFRVSLNTFTSWSLVHLSAHLRTLRTIAR